jgi:hypothetical protein
LILTRIIFALPVRFLGSDFTVGDSVPLFGGREAPTGPWTFTRDGRRVLAATPTGEERTETLTLVQYWRGGK